MDSPLSRRLRELPPVLCELPASVTEGEELQLQPAKTGRTVTSYRAATALPPWLQLDGATGVVSGRPPLALPEPLELLIVATGPEGDFTIHAVVNVAKRVRSLRSSVSAGSSLPLSSSNETIAQRPVNSEDSLLRRAGVIVDRPSVLARNKTELSVSSFSLLVTDPNHPMANKPKVATPLILNALEPTHVIFDISSDTTIDFSAVRVEPPLPAGLFLSQGVLVGEALKPHAKSRFLVTWPGAAAWIELEVLDNPLAEERHAAAWALSQDHGDQLSVFTMLCGQSVRITMAGIIEELAARGCTAADVSVHPMLPDGLVLHKPSLSIMGTATVAMPPTLFTMKMANCAARFVLAVEDSPACAATAALNLSPSEMNNRFEYVPSVLYLAPGEQLTLEPCWLVEELSEDLASARFAICSVSTPLPPDVRLDRRTGQLSGSCSSTCTLVIEARRSPDGNVLGVSTVTLCVAAEVPENTPQSEQQAALLAAYGDRARSIWPTLRGRLRLSWQDRSMPKQVVSADMVDDAKLAEELRRIEIMVEQSEELAKTEGKSGTAAGGSSPQSKAAGDVAGVLTLTALEPVHVRLETPAATTVGQSAVRIKPALPAGLFLSQGVLVGEALKPHAKSRFLITWQGAAAFMELEVLENPQSEERFSTLWSLSNRGYGGSSISTHTLLCGQCVRLELSNAAQELAARGCTAADVSVHPLLPDGLVLHKPSLSIMGTATVAMPPTLFTLKMANCAARFVLAVEDSPACAATAALNLSPSEMNNRFEYVPSVLYLAPNEQLTLEPCWLDDVAAIDRFFAVSALCAPLPPDIRLDRKSGRLSGFCGNTCTLVIEARRLPDGRVLGASTVTVCVAGDTSLALSPKLSEAQLKSELHALRSTWPARHTAVSLNWYEITDTERLELEEMNKVSKTLVTRGSFLSLQLNWNAQSTKDKRMLNAIEERDGPMSPTDGDPVPRRSTSRANTDSDEPSKTSMHRVLSWKEPETRVFETSTSNPRPLVRQDRAKLLTPTSPADSAKQDEDAEQQRLLAKQRAEKLKQEKEAMAESARSRAHQMQEQRKREEDAAQVQRKESATARIERLKAEEAAKVAAHKQKLLELQLKRGTSSTNLISDPNSIETPSSGQPVSAGIVRSVKPPTITTAHTRQPSGGVDATTSPKPSTKGRSKSPKQPRSPGAERARSPAPAPAKKMLSPQSPGGRGKNAPLSPVSPKSPKTIVLQKPPIKRRQKEPSPSLDDATMIRSMSPVRSPTPAAKPRRTAAVS